MQARRIVISNFDDLKNPYYGGGGALAVHQIAKRLASKNQVTVFTSKYPGSLDQKLDSVQYRRVGLDLPLPKLSQFIFQLVLPYYLLTTRFDIWVENLTPPLPFDLLPLLTKKPVVALVHMLPGEDMQRKYRLPFVFFEKLLLRAYPRFIVVTQKLKTQVLSIHPRAEVVVATNGLADEFFTPVKLARPRHIFYVGRLEYNQKGLDLLLEAFALLRQKHPAKLVIAGSGIATDLKAVRQKISQLRLGQSVTLVGRIDRIQLFRYLSQAYFTVVSSRFETFGTVALESIARGVPVVSFDINGLKWMPSGTALKAEPFDIAQLAAHMAKLYQSSALRTRMGRLGLQTARKYTWDSPYRIFNRFLSKLSS